jgi:hypothetical protein
VSRSFGRQGVWPFDDYTAFDDTTLVWWDPNAVGEDEIGHQGKGMWSYIDGGKRYLPGTVPPGEPRFFDANGAVTKYDQLPAQDQYPQYDNKRYRGQ